jgi:hypothetical protein
MPPGPKPLLVKSSFLASFPDLCGVVESDGSMPVEPVFSFPV